VSIYRRSELEFAAGVELRAGSGELILSSFWPDVIWPGQVFTRARASVKLLRAPHAMRVKQLEWNESGWKRGRERWANIELSLQSIWSTFG